MKSPFEKVKQRLIDNEDLNGKLSIRVKDGSPYLMVRCGAIEKRVQIRVDDSQLMKMKL